MRWNVKGVVGKSGQDMTIVVNARSKEEARELAAKRGMKVVALRPSAPIVRVHEDKHRAQRERAAAALALTNQEVAAAIAEELTELTELTEPIEAPSASAISLTIPSSPLLDDARSPKSRKQEAKTEAEAAAYGEILMAARWLRVIAMFVGCFGWLALGGGLALLLAPVTKRWLSQTYQAGDMMPDTLLLAAGLTLLIVANLVQAGEKVLVAVRDMARKHVSASA
jgi:hypothetical protein